MSIHMWDVPCMSSQALPIDKWACPSIEIVEIQQATSAGAGIQLAIQRGDTPLYRVQLSASSTGQNTNQRSTWNILYIVNGQPSIFL